jgi:hypothetical protein
MNLAIEMYLQEAFANPVTVNPDRNMKNEECCSQLLEYYEQLRTVREILLKEQQQRAIQTKLDSFFKPA